MNATAPLVAGWNRRQWKPAIGINAPGPMNPAGQPFDTGPAGPIGLTVELCFDTFNDIWTDISRYVYYRDRIKVTRGRADESTQPQPQGATLTLNNRDARFSPRNPTGFWYGLIGRNTPIRISRKVNGSDTAYYRFWGEVPSWPTTSEISGTDVNTPIQASGILRRLNQGSPLAYSAFYQSVSTNFNISYCLAYWPCEDGPDSTQIAAVGASLPAAANPMSLSGQALPTFANNSDFLCSGPLPLLSASIWTGYIPSDIIGGAPSPANVLRFLLGIPATGAYDTAVVARLYTTGTVARLDVQYGVLNNGSLQLAGYNKLGSQLFATGYGFANLDNTPIRVSMEMVQSGSNVVCTLAVLATGAASNPSSFQATVTGATLGTATSVVINPDGHLNDTAVGHITYQDNYESLLNLKSALNANLGESTGDRFTFASLTLQSTPPNTAIFDTAFSDSGVTMGYQLPGTYTGLVQEVTDTDGGILLEARDQSQLLLRQRVSMYNQTPKLTLDLSQHHLSAPLVPEDDDRFTRNLITVTRINGSSAQAILKSGPLSTGEVGTYESSISLSLGTDSQAADQAGWRLMLGTTDRERYPQVSINLRHPTFTSNAALTQAALNVEIGDTIKLVNLPSWLPPDPALLIVQGYSETLGVYEHDITFNCSPADPYQIAILEDPVLGRADTDETLLFHTYTATDTLLTVWSVNASSGSPVWTVDANDLPFDVNIGGERITVTAISTQFPGADGTFETGVTGWTAGTNCTLAQTGADHFSGTQSALITATASSTTLTIVLSGRFTVTGSDTYTLAVWFKLAAGSVSGAVGTINWYDATNTFISSATVGTATTLGSTWVQIKGSATAPSNAASATFGPSAGPVASGAAMYVDNIAFWDANGVQQMTVIRSVNGVVKAQTAATDVRLWQPMILSL